MQTPFQAVYNTVGIFVLFVFLGMSFWSMVRNPNVWRVARTFLVGVVIIASFVWINELTFGQQCSKVYTDQVEYAECVKRLQKDEPLVKETYGIEETHVLQATEGVSSDVLEFTENI